MSLRRKGFFWASVLLLCIAGGLVTQTADPLTRTTPAWFDEAKLGVFIHWPVGSIPAFAGVAGQAHTPVTSAEAMRAARQRRSTSGGWDSSKNIYTENYARGMLYPGSATARYHAEHYGNMPVRTARRTVPR